MRFLITFPGTNRVNSQDDHWVEKKIMAQGRSLCWHTSFQDPPRPTQDSPGHPPGALIMCLIPSCKDFRGIISSIITTSPELGKIE